MISENATGPTIHDEKGGGKATQPTVRMDCPSLRLSVPGFQVGRVVVNAFAALCKTDLCHKMTFSLSSIADAALFKPGIVGSRPQSL